MESFGKPAHVERLQEWVAVLERLFPVSLPSRAVWLETSRVGEVIAEIARPPSPHTAIDPAGALLEIRGWEQTEEGCHLVTHKGRTPIAPRGLTFEGHADPTLAYLRLRLGPIGDSERPGALVIASAHSPLLQHLQPSLLGAMRGRELRKQVEGLGLLLGAQTISGA